MTLPTSEVLVFDTSDAFRANPEILVPAFQRLRAEGVNAPIYSGLEAENPNVGFIIVNWDSYEHHQQVQKAPFYPEVSQDLRLVLAGPPKPYHVQFSAPTAAFDEPVTEVLLLTLKSPEQHTALVNLLTSFKLVFGQTREDENKFIVIGGWASVEAHREVLAIPASAAALEQLFSLADRDLYHAKLKKY